MDILLQSAYKTTVRPDPSAWTYILDMLIHLTDASDAGAPTFLQFFCSTCNDPGSVPKGFGNGRRDLQNLEERAACPAGTIVPGLQLVVTTFQNNTGFIGPSNFANCPS